MQPIPRMSVGRAPHIANISVPKISGRFVLSPEKYLRSFEFLQRSLTGHGYLKKETDHCARRSEVPGLSVDIKGNLTAGGNQGY